MGRRYFGTDGVRGRVGEHPMTVDFALHLASAAARVLAPEGGTVLIGKDTRLSGYMFESALEAGFVAAGVDVMLIGPLPTPGIAYMTRRFSCDFGVVISASHNLYEDNGIKFFDADGAKLSDELEERIEAELAQPALTRTSQKLGRASRVDRSRTHYQEFCAQTLPPGLDLAGLKIVIDCANGAAYKVAPQDARRSGRGDRAHRLLAQRAQHQRRLRVDGAGAAAAHGARGARQRRGGARWRRRSPGHGRSPGQDRRWRSAAVRHRAGAEAGRHAARARRRYRDEQPRPRGGAARRRHRLPARRGRRPLRARHAA